MENENIHVSRRVRIKLKNSTEAIEGSIIYENKLTYIWDGSNCLACIKFRFNDKANTEKVFNRIDVDTIDYLQAD